jgi:hypothetical protein
VRADLCFSDEGAASVKFIDNSGDEPDERVIPLPDD